MALLQAIVDVVLSFVFVIIVFIGNQPTLGDFKYFGS